MNILTSKTDQTLTRLILMFITLSVLTILASEARAYDEYSDCKDCHGSFRNSPYISLADGASWGDNLHNVHRNDMLAGDCDVCHNSSGKSKVFLDSSTGGSGLAPISCVGCHGREEDIGNDNISSGRGAGLRQHHTNAGQTACMNCHSDANPANYTPVGEDVLPEYFANPGTNHPAMPANSCSPAGEEDFAATILGLDNDGDGSYDTADSDCIETVTYTVGGNVSGLTSSGLAIENNGADTIAVTTDGPFTFATHLEEGSTYAVTVSAQPDGQICSVSNGSGTVTTENVTNVAVTCEDQPSQLHAGFNDAWYDPLTDGQGFFITIFPDLGTVALAWFTYDTELPPENATANLGDPGHRWMTASGPFVDNQAVLNIVLTSGGIFDTPGEVQRTDPPGSDGTLILTFDSCSAGTIEYDIPSINRQAVIPIQRVADDNIVLCETLNSN